MHRTAHSLLHAGGKGTKSYFYSRGPQCTSYFLFGYAGCNPLGKMPSLTKSLSLTAINIQCCLIVVSRMLAKRSPEDPDRKGIGCRHSARKGNFFFAVNILQG
jgi:hypothetical protein